MPELNKALTKGAPVVNYEDYGLEHSKAQAVQAYFSPMMDKMVDLEKQTNEVLELYREQGNTEAVIEAAKPVYKTLVKTRTGTAKIHKEVKAVNLKEGRFIDSHKNTQAMISEPLEKSLKAIIDEAENKERERIAKVRVQRIAQLVNLGVEEKDIPDSVGIMPDSMWEPLVFGAQAKYDKKIAEEKAAAEAERLAKEAEEKERLEQEAKRKAGQERLQKEAAENKAKADKLEAERKALLKKQNEEKAKADAAAKKQADLIEAQNKKIAEAKQREDQANKKAAEAEAKRVEAENRAKLVERQSKPRELRTGPAAQPTTLFPTGDTDKESVKLLVAELEALKIKYSFKAEAYKSFYKRTGATIDRIVSASKFIK